jgi:hypothetical protein
VIAELTLFGNGGRVSATRKQSADPGAAPGRGGMAAFSWVKLPESPRQVRFVVRAPKENAGCRAETILPY